MALQYGLLGAPARVGTPASKPVYTSGLLTNMAQNVQAQPWQPATGSWMTLERGGADVPGAPGGWQTASQGLPGGPYTASAQQYAQSQDYSDAMALKDRYGRGAEQLAMAEQAQQGAYDTYLRGNTGMFGQAPFPNGITGAGFGMPGVTSPWSQPWATQGQAWPNGVFGARNPWAAV